MRFFTAIIASLAILSSTTSAASLTQLLTSSHIVDLVTVDTTTNTAVNEWRQYQSVKVDDMTKLQTTIVTKQWMMSPFNQTITYEAAKLSGTGGSAMDGPIYDYTATSYAQSQSGAGRVWTGCAASSLPSRQPDYCTEVVPSSPSTTMSCGRDMTQTCTVSQVVCRHNSVIQPAMYFMLDSNNGSIVASMDSMNSTFITFWSNLNDQPTIGQFGDAILLPARTSCPDNNNMFPATFGTAPVLPMNNSSSSSSSSTGSVINRSSSSSSVVFPSSSSSTGIQFGAASSSLPTLSALVMILPAVVSAFLRV